MTHIASCSNRPIFSSVPFELSPQIGTTNIQASRDLDWSKNATSIDIIEIDLCRGAEPCEAFQPQCSEPCIEIHCPAESVRLVYVEDPHELVKTMGQIDSG